MATEAEFFSFGTNDLTQTTFGMSRDDAESKFLIQFGELGVLPSSPFRVPIARLAAAHAAMKNG